MKKKLAFVLAMMMVCISGAWADGPFRNHRYDSFKTLPAVGNDDVVFIGNSITNMFNWWEALGSNQKIKGRGNSGAVTQEVLDNLESMIAGQPAKVFLMIGTNDLGTAGIDDPKYVASQIETIITRIRKESPRTMVYCQSILPSGLRNAEKIKQTNQLVSAWITATADSQVEYVNLYPLLDDGTGKIKSTANNGTSANSYDNLHLTALGYRLWLEAIKDRLPADCQCQIPEGIETLGSGLGGSTGMRSTYFGALPVKASDILIIGDEMIHGCEWHELLGADFKDRGSGWGYPGVNIANMTAELSAIFSGNASKVSKQTPKAVCLYAGVADCNASDYNEATVNAAYKALVDGIRAKVSASTPIFLMTLAPHPTAANNDRAKALNAYMQTLAGGDANLHLIDLYSAAMNGSARQESYFMGTNNAYISGLGYVAFANAIKSAVNAALGSSYTCITLEQAQANLARFNSRKAIGDATNLYTAIEAYEGNGIGQYSASAVAAYKAAIEPAFTALQSLEPSTSVDFAAAKATLMRSLTAVTSANANGRQFAISTPNRMSLYAYTDGAALNGSGSNPGLAKYRWTLESRGDGTFNIKNVGKNVYMNPSAAHDTQIQMSATAPSAGWTLDYSDALGLYIIKSGTTCELNSTDKSGNPIYNWHGNTGATKRDDAGCQWLVEDVTDMPVPSDLYKVTSASQLTPGLYIIKDVVTNSAQENRRGFVNLNSNLALNVNTTDRNKDASDILDGSAYSSDYIWRLAKSGDKWTIECANASHYYFPTIDGRGKMTASTTAGQYTITDHATGNGTLSLKGGSYFVNADPGQLSGWDNAHEIELYKIESLTDEEVTLTYKTAANETVGSVRVNLPSKKGPSQMTYDYNCPSGYSITGTNGNTITVIGSLKDGQTYYIASDNRSAQYYLLYNGSGLGLNSQKSKSPAYMWTCVKNGNYFTFRNVESGKWLSHKGVADNAYNFIIDPNQKVSEGCLPLYSVGASRYMLVKNDGTGFDQATVPFNKNTTNYSSDYVFTECDPVDAVMSDSFEDATWLRLSNGNFSNYVWTNKGATVANGTAQADASSADQLFAFVGDNANGFIIYNKVLGSSYTLTSANTNNGTAATWQKGAANPTKWYIQSTYVAAAEKAGYVITTDKAGTQGLNMYGGQGGDVKYWAASDGGTHWTISAVDSEPTIIHYAVTGTKKFQDANQWVGQLKLQKGSFQSQTLVEANVDGTTFNAYLPKSSDELVISNFNLHGWTFSQEKRNGEYYVTYTADLETEYQYLGLRPDAQWYRIPAIASAKSGDLVAIYDWRVCHSDVGFGEVDQRMRRSGDFGKTWSTEQTIADGNGGGKVFGAAFGDPALAADRESGKMTLITVSGTTVYTYATATDHNLVSVQFSEDNGLTWSEPENITNQFWGAATGMLADADTEAASTTFAYSGFFGSGKILQSRVTKVGDYYRLYAAMLCRGKNVQGAYVVYSDDMGHTWQLLGGDNTVKAASGSDEPKVEELPNGDIVLSCRKYYGRYFNIWSWTALPTKESPLGAGKWGSVVDSNTIGTGIKVGGNSCNGEILLVDVLKADGTPAKLMMQSLPSGNDRSGVEIWYKDVTNASAYTDVTTFASNWTRGLRVSPQSPENFSAYSTMCLQQDGRIGFFYEEGPATYAMVYVPLTIEKITNGAYKGVPVVLPTEAYIQAVGELKSAYTDKANVQLGDGWLDFTASDPAALQSAMEAAEPYVGMSAIELNNASPAVSIDDLQEMTSNLEAINIVQKVKKGNFVRLKGYSNNYVSMPTTGTNGKMVNAEDASTILYLSPEGQLISFGTGYGLNQTSITAAPGTTLCKYTVLSSGRADKYYVKSDASGIGTYLYDNTANGTKVDRNTTPVTSGNYQTDWTIAEVKTLPLAMNQADGAYYATINLPVAANIPAGLVAYSAMVNGDVLTLTKVVEDGILAANTPVVLYSENNVKGLDLADAAGAGATTNELQGTLAAINVQAGENYVLSGKDGIGFYKYNNTLMPGFKAYLPLVSSVEAFSFSFEDVETAIQAIESANGKHEIFDLNGRRVEKAQKGVYMVNGKKVLYM